jgi:predicted PurR-regulated permease PerM
MTAQHIFYILGSITFGAFIVFLIVITIISIGISKQIRKLTDRLHETADEVQGMIETAKVYTQAVGENVGFRMLHQLIKFFKSK